MTDAERLPLADEEAHRELYELIAEEVAEQTVRDLDELGEAA